jgi:HAD superfamily hydrolase (TIGR01509 family)
VSPAGIEAIVFDYGNVISRFDVQLYFRGILPYSSLSQVDLALAMKGSSQVIVTYESGGMSSDQFFAAISERCSLQMTREEFVRVYNGIFEPIETTRDLIRQLHGRYRLGLLSNTSEWHFQHEISRNPIFPLFEAVTVSHEVKLRKPAEAIYRDILRKLNLPPAACVYVDDIAEFALAATRLGMHGVHYTTHEKLLEHLSEIGIRIAAADGTTTP